MTDEKNHVWDLNVIQRSRLRVVFAEEISRDDAIRALLDGEYEDIIDEECFEIETAS